MKETGPFYTYLQTGAEEHGMCTTQDAQMQAGSLTGRPLPANTGNSAAAAQGQFELDRLLLLLHY